MSDQTKSQPAPDRRQVRLGIAFPHGDPGFSEGGSNDAPREFVLAAEANGFEYLAMADHVLGIDPATRPGWSGAYDTADPFREIFVHLGYLAAITRMELVPSVLVLPQRQTAVVAKQAVELSMLSRGGLRLGVGIGWNKDEFGALGASFRDRAVLMEEQILVLRRLWSEPIVSFSGHFHHLDRVGLAPLPKTHIPVWIGGGYARTEEAQTRVFTRIARLGDGWISGPGLPIERLALSMARIRGHAETYGRDPETLGLQATLAVTPGKDQRTLKTELELIQAANPSHITVDCRKYHRSLSEHIADSNAIRAWLSNELCLSPGAGTRTRHNT